MTRARDVGVVVIAVSAVFLALQGTPEVGIQLRWVIGGQATGGSEHQRTHPLPIPQPLVADLDGDGRSEVVMLSDDRMTVRVLSIPHALAEALGGTRGVLMPQLGGLKGLIGALKYHPQTSTLARDTAVIGPKSALVVDPVVLHEEMIAPGAHAPGERHVVAMAAGHLDSSIPTSTSRLKQHLVVVREDWKVICYDHNLERVWKTALPHVGSLGEGGSFVIDQIAIAVTHAASEMDSQGGRNREASTGSVLIGASMRHRDGRDHTRAARGPADASRSDGNPLGVHVEAFVEGQEDSRDEQEEAEMSEEEKQRRAAEHFSIIRLDGRSGDVVWKHVARGHQEDQDTSTETDATIRRPHYKLEELDDLSRPVDDQRSPGSGSGGDARRYRRSLLHLLPHAWSASVDTRLEVAMLHRRGPSGRGSGEGVGGQRMRSYSSVKGKPSMVNEDGRGRAETRGKRGGVVQAVVARTREGLEAVELSTGKPLGSVALPAAPSGAGGVYADLNGDGVVDHVQAVGTQGVEGWGHLHSGLATKSSPSEARQTRRLPPCYALAVSGLPPREQLFNGSICHDGGALLEMGERLSKPSSRLGPRSEVKVGASVPAVFPRGVPIASARYSGKVGMTGGGGGSRKESRSDVVFAVSSGVVSCYDDEGHLKWQDRRGPKWGLSQGKLSKEGDNGDEDTRGYVVPFKLEVAAGGGNAVDSFLAEERILVVGNDKICVFDLDGRLSGQAPLVSTPSQPPVVGDFDSNGIADVVVLGRSGLAAGYVLAPDPGIRALFVAVLVLIGAMLVVAAVYVPPPGDRKGSWRQGSVVPKPKRATD